MGDLGFGYVIRFRAGTSVTAADGETRRAEDWVGGDGRARKLVGAVRVGNPYGATGCCSAPHSHRAAP